MLRVSVSVSGGTKLGELGLRTWAGLGVGLNSNEQGLHLWFICTGHARCY